MKFLYSLFHLHVPGYITNQFNDQLLVGLPAQSTVPKKMVTSTFPRSSERMKTIKLLIKLHSKVLLTSNLAQAMLLLQGSPQNMTLFVTGLVRKGIVVKCTAAIFFRSAD